MPRIRTIKPEFPQSESIGRLSRDARLLFIQLWTIADDAGRTRAASRMLASLLYPYDNDAAKLIDKWLAELASENMVTLYECDGSKYLEITKWLEHQKIDRPSQSRLPAPIEGSRILANNREGSTTDLGPVPSTSTKDQGPSAPDFKKDFLDWWAVYPRREGKADAQRAYEKAVKRADHETLMAGAKRVADNPPTEAKFIPMPATWLNGDRWLDEKPARNQAAAGATQASAPDHVTQWRARLRSYKPRGFWPDTWGNRPEVGNPLIPPDVYADWRDGKLSGAA